MNVAELIEQMARRVGGLDNVDRVAAMIDDYTAAGVKEGPALQRAFDAYRVKWDKRYAPTAAEFLEKFYAGPRTTNDGRSPADAEKIKLAMRWRKMREPLERFAGDHILHVRLMREGDYSIDLFPLSQHTRDWWKQNIEEAGHIIGRDIVLTGPGTLKSVVTQFEIGLG